LFGVTFIGGGLLRMMVLLWAEDDAQIKSRSEAIVILMVQT
jgi:hypothetical protein